MDELIEQLKFEEGFRSDAYRCPAGKLTIGYGHNLEAKPFFEGGKIPLAITETEAEAILLGDIESVYHTLAEVWHGFDLMSTERKEACVNMAFQIGVRGFINFKKMLNHLVRCDWRLAYKEAMDSAWARQTPARAERVATQILTGVRYQVPN